MRKIILSQGKVALVSEEDYERVMEHTWHAARKQYVNGETWYAATRRSELWLHRFIMHLEPFDGKEVDHIDGDGLNNQRSNLRIVTHGENLHNRKVAVRSKSGVKGVSPNGMNWVATINVNGQQIYLGTFSTIKEAGATYEKASIKFYGRLPR